MITRTAGRRISRSRVPAATSHTGTARSNPSKREGVTVLLSSHLLDQVQRLFDVNVFGSIQLSQLVIPHMKAQGGGHIVNLTTTLASGGKPLKPTDE